MSVPTWNVRLRIVSEVLTVAEITRIVGVSPDRSSDRGSLRRGSSLALRFSAWEFESGLSATADVTEHVSRIVERLETHAVALRSAAGLADGFELSIVGRFDPALDHSPGLNLTVDHLAFLTSVGASLDLEIIPEAAPASGTAHGPDATLVIEE